MITSVNKGIQCVEIKVARSFDHYESALLVANMFADNNVSLIISSAELDRYHTRYLPLVQSLIETERLCANNRWLLVNTSDHNDEDLLELLRNFKSRSNIWLTLNNGYTFYLSNLWESDLGFFIIKNDLALNINDNIEQFIYADTSIYIVLSYIKEQAALGIIDIPIWIRGLPDERATRFIVKLKSKIQDILPNIVIYFILDDYPRTYGLSAEDRTLWEYIASDTQSYTKFIDIDETVSYLLDIKSGNRGMANASVEVTIDSNAALFESLQNLEAVGATYELPKVIRDTELEVIKSKALVLANRR